MSFQASLTLKTANMKQFTHIRLQIDYLRFKILFSTS